MTRSAAASAQRGPLGRKKPIAQANSSRQAAGTIRKGMYQRLWKASESENSQVWTLSTAMVTAKARKTPQKMKPRRRSFIVAGPSCEQRVECAHRGLGPVGMLPHPGRDGEEIGARIDQRARIGDGDAADGDAGHDHHL